MGGGLTLGRGDKILVGGSVDWGDFSRCVCACGGGGGGMMSKFLASVEGLLPSPAGRENPDTRPCQSQTPSTIHYKKSKICCYAAGI